VESALSWFHHAKGHKELVGLSMCRLQIQLFGPDFRSFLAHRYDYEPSNDQKSGLKLQNFHFGPYSPTGS